MAVFKATKNKSDSSGTFKATERRSYDSNIVYDWETRNKESHNILEEYRQKVNNGGYLSADDLTAYRKAIDNYVETASGLRGVSKALGQGDVDDDDTWATTISQMESGFKDISEFYSKWKTEDDFKASLDAQKDLENLSSFDLNAGQKEVEELEKVLNEYEALTRKVQTLATSSPEYISATNRLEEISKQYGGKGKAGIESVISEKKSYVNRAKYIQEGIALSGVANSDDFDLHSGYVSTKSDDWWRKLTGNEYDATYEYINNQNGFRDEYKSNHRNMTRDNPWSDGESTYEEKGYDHISEDEIAIYNYYYAKEGKEAAQKYLDSIQETLSARKATTMFSNMEDNPLLELAFQVEVGLDQFKSGAEGAWNAIIGKDEYTPASATQMAGSKAYEDLGDVDLKWYNFKEGNWDNAKIFDRSLGQVAANAISTTANMAPSIMTSLALSMVNPVAGSAWVTAGQIAGTGMMGVSAAGNAYQEAINLGYDKDQARAYGVLVGGSEAGLQYLLGGISKLGGTVSNGVVTKMLSGVDDAFFRTAGKLAGNMLSEGIEEGLQEILTPWFQNLVLHTNNDVDWNEVAYSSLLGALTAGFLEGGSTIAGEVNTYNTGKKLQEKGISAQRLSELGKTFSTDTVAYQLAGRVNDNTGAYTMGRLFNEIGAELTDINKSDIASYLEEKGVSGKDAKIMAEAFANVVVGAEFTDQQIAMIEANDTLAKAVVDVIINPNSTVNQRSQGYNEMLMALAKEKTSSDASRTSAIEAGKESVPSEVESSTVSENASESRYEVSEAGEWVNTKTDSSIEPQGLVQAEDGTYMIAAKDADPVASGDVSYPDADHAIVYETFLNLDRHSGKISKVLSDMDLDSRNALLGLYNPSVNKSGGAFVNGVLDAYFYGHRGIDMSAAGKKSPMMALTKEQRQSAWNTGRTAGIKTDAEVQSNVDTVYEEAQKVLKQTGAKKGDYHAKLVDGITIEQLTDQQRAVYDIADNIAQGVQTNIRVYAGTNKAQGFYNHATDEIWLNLNAAKSGREHIMAFTLAHELVHRAKKGSPAKYQAFTEFLMKEYGKQGSDVDAMIAEQIAAAERFNKTVPDAQKVNMTREKALEEVVCDACQRMLLDTNAGQKLAEFGAQSKQNKSFLEDLKRWISELLENLRNFFKGIDPDSKAAREFAKFDANVKQTLAKMYVDMSIDAGEKLSTIKAAYGGAFADKFFGIKDILYNLAAVETHKDKLQNEYSEDSSTNLETIVKRYDKIIDIWTRLGGELNSKFLADWNSKVGKDRTFTIFKAQAGYKYNVELSSMCKKGVPLFEAIDTIVKQEVMKEIELDVLGKAEKEILYDILKQHHFEIPCAICYVEQARQREGVIIDAFLNGKVDKNAKGETTKVKLGWNQVLDSIQKEMKAGGVDYSFAQVSRDIATEKYMPANLDMDIKTQVAFYAALKKIANQEIARYNKAEGKSRKLLAEVTPAAVKECFKGTLPANLKIFKVLFEEPSSRFKITSDLLYSSVATQNLSMAHNKLYGLFNSQGGVSGYKTKQGTTIYWGDILGKSWKPDTLRNEGGVRNQSNSDFQMYTLLDQAQMYIDFTAKGYYLQAYTKVLSELKLFGLSRGKINASLIPKVVVYYKTDGSVDIEKTMATAGLDENGNPIYDDIEGINHKEAFMLIEDSEYSKSICGICIGYSDAHINKLLDDNRVQQIIGFHDKTDDGSKRYKGAMYAKNYNGLNEAVNKEGKTVHIGFNPYVKKAEKKFQFNAETETFEGTVNYNGKTYTADDIPRLAADLYLEMCAKKEYTPAYDDFKGHPNYYKLLADFGLYDSQGHYAPHRKVVYNMPDTVPYLDANGKKQTMKTYDYIKAELVKELTVRDSISEALADTSSEGIIPQFKAAVKKSQEEKSLSLPKTDSEGSNLSAEQQEFFKDSVVRDADGNLMVMYHGTANGGAFTVFDGDKLGNRTLTSQIGQGFYFTNVKKEAESYMKNVDIYGKVSNGKNPNLHQVYLNITNPFDINSDTLDIDKVKSVYMDGAYDYFFDNYIPFYLNKKTVNGRAFTKAELQDMSKADRVSLYVDYLAQMGTKEMLSNMVQAFKFNAQSQLLASMKNRLGYDGIVEEFKPGQYQYVAFSSEQIKNVDNQNPTTDPDIRYSLPKGEPAPTFYSQMAKVVDGLKQEKHGAASVVSTLRNKGVKAEEIKWSGIEAWLEGKKSVTKAELQEFIAGSMLQIEEEILDNKDRPYTEDQQKRLDEYEAKRDEVAKRLAEEWKKITGDEFPIQNAGAGLESSVVNKIIDANKEHKDASFEGRLLKKLRKDLQAVIENNDDFGFDSWKDALRSIHRHRRDFIKNYEMSTNDKAVIVKYCNALNAYNELPNRISDEDTDRLRSIALETDPWNRKIMEVKHEHNEEEAKYMTNWKQYSLEGGRNYREMLFRIPGSTYSNEAMFTHWKERKGVLAHARVQDMDTFIGKMLFIEEIQSDWHNAGHKDGYRDPSLEDKHTLSQKMEKYTEEFFSSSTAEMVKERITPIGYEGAGVSMILNFLIDSQESMQSTLNTLSRKGASFTDSEVSEIAKYASEYEEMYHKWETAPGDLTAPDAPFKDTYHEYVLKRLLREAAEQDYDSIGWTTAETQDERWQNNLPHKEGTGKSGFLVAYRNVYDRRMKKFLSDFGEKWGTTVGKTVLDNGTEVWSMAITDEMKDSVLYEGQVVYSLPKGGYDYSKSFEEQVDDYKSGNIPSGDTLIVGPTPEVFQKIGFTALPMSINTTHVDYALYGTKDADHYLGEALLKQLPNSIKEPAAIFVSQTQKSTSVVALLRFQVNGKQAVAPVVIDGVGHQNGIRIDSNAVTSVFGKTNAVSKLLVDSIADEMNGQFSLLYINKKEAESILQSAGLQLPGGLRYDGFIHSIREANSPVKPKFANVTETQQFKRWFKRSKVVDQDGTPRIVYHHTNDEFWTFDTARSGSNQGNTLGDGIYLSTSPDMFSYAGKNRMELYARIQKPFEMKLTKKQATYVLEKYAAKKHNLDQYNGLYRNHAMEKLTSPVRVFDYLSQYAAENGIKVSDILKDLGYDGVHSGSEWVAFDANQVKSATDNIGTFDGGNTDIRYKLPIGEDTSPRALLANAFEGIITNDIEKRKIQEYKGKVEMLNAEEQKLHELRAEIKELSFAKGKRDTKKIKELQFDANQTANRIATLDKMLLGLEASAPLQNILKREKEMAYKRAEQKGKEALEAYKKAERERDQKWQREVKEKYQASKQKAIETREKREAREKLQKLVIDTVKWITYPSKTDVKCPDILKRPYADFLNGIDLSSKRVANGGDPTKNDLRLTNAMDSLATALDKIMTSQDPTQETDKVLDTGYLDLPADFVKKLRDMTEKVKDMMVDGDYVVNNMSAGEVRQLSQMIRTLNHAIKEVSTLYANLRFANVEALGDNTMEFMDDLGEIDKTGGAKDFVQWDNALPYYAFKRFGEGGESIFEGLMDAQDKLAFLAQKIFDFQEKTWTGKEAKSWSEDTHTISLPDGDDLTLTTADAMSIYCLSRREQGLQHLLGGGTRVMGIQKGSQKAKDSRSTLTIKDINAINSSLTDRQRAVADGIQEFMSTVCSEWGNEISMKRFLTKEFTEKVYFPIESNDENLPTKDPAAQQSDLFRLLNISATKPLTPGANNEVIIRNIFDVFTGHASDMARLNAYGMGLLDYMKWLNYREKSVNEEGQIKVRGVRKSMEQAYGNAAKSYVLNLIKDVNGRPSDGGDPNILMKWMRNAKIASVGANLRVAALQFTAYPRAAMALSTRSIALGLTKAPQISKAKKYCGIALWKSFGFYDTNIARSIEDQMKGVKDVKQKIIELSLKGAEWGDAITWGCLWNACEYEVASTKEFKVGTEEFYQAVGKKLREVVYRTQVVDSTLTRSQMMRSKRGMAQEAASFMSEPTLSANILMDAGFQFEAEKRRTGSVNAAWKKAGPLINRAVAVYSCVALMGALVESLGDAWRDDDDEEFYKKFFEALPDNILLNMLPFNKVPILSDLVELALSLLDIGFFSSEKLSTQWLSQTASAVDAWGDVFSGKSTATVYGALYKTVKALSSASGLPISGAMRECVALWNNTAGAYDTTWKLRTYGQTQGDLRNGLYDAIVSGNDRQAESIKAEFRERADDEKDYQSDINAAIRKALRENDPRIKKAAQAVVDGNARERANIAKEIEAEGHFNLQDIQAAINAEIDKLRKEAKGQ